MLSSDQHELLSQARQRTATLLQNLQRGRIELHTASTGCSGDTVGDAAYADVIDAARGTLDNLDRALQKSDGPDPD